MKPVTQLGPHKLPLIGRADWNDCLNLNCFSTDPNESFQTCTSKDGKTAESVFIAGLLVYAAPDFIALARLSKDEKSVSIAEQAVKSVSEAVMKDGWDGEWYMRAYDDFGHKIGSKDCEEAKIWIEPQGMCSMARIGADSGMPRKSLNSVAKHLETEYGLVLLDPCYQRYHVELGEVSSYPPGYKENGGIFTHNNPWAVLAACAEGMPEEAWRWYTKIAPGWVEKRSELHRMEPYVFAQMIAGKGAKRHGEAKNSWLTGAASWTLVSAEQGILGVKPGWDGLIVDPVLPKAMPSVHVERQFRGARYLIDARIDPSVKQPELTVDGKLIQGTTVPLAASGAVVKISVKVPARS
jgi:cellobiose phosphorylase